jgi:sugar/nucleoside kinase (ribokinase family)
MTPEAVVIGNIIKETIVDGEKITGPVLGSPAAYSSLAMASAGCATGLVSYYGNDLPEQIRELAVVDTSGLIPFAYSSTNTLTYASDGTKKVTFDRKAPDLGIEDVPTSWLDARIFHICPMDYDVRLDLVETLTRRKKTVVVDLGGYGGATSQTRHSVGSPQGSVVIRRLCISGSYLKASAEDLASIFPGRTVEQAADDLIALGAPVVVVTLGAEGAMLVRAGQPPVRVPGYAATSQSPDGSLNSTGAGDAFDGGFIAALSASAEIEDAVRFGNATASHVIEGAGGCVAARMPSKGQVIERMRQGEAVAPPS